MTPVFWFTGLSGAGKTTIADAAAAQLAEAGYRIRILDGDDVRARQHRHLGFSEADILENNRLIAQLCVDAQEDTDIIFVPIISPFEKGRASARIAIGDAFRLVYFNAGLDHVSAADVKGLYRRASDGEIDNMIGVAASNPYEPPHDADLEIDISRESSDQSISRFLAFVNRTLND